MFKEVFKSLFSISKERPFKITVICVLILIEGLGFILSVPAPDYFLLAGIGFLMLDDFTNTLIDSIEMRAKITLDRVKVLEEEMHELTRRLNSNNE